jgi:hypothetical protein
MVTHLQAILFLHQHHLTQTSIKFKALRTNFIGISGRQTPNELQEAANR